MGVSVLGTLRKYHLGESRARIVIATGFYEDLGTSPTYEHLATATGRSLSRIRSIVSEMLKEEHKLIEVSEGEEGKRIVRLTAEGREVYEDLLKTVTAREGRPPQTPQDAVRKLDKVLYSSSKPRKFFGDHTIVQIDTVVPALNIPEIVRRLKEAKEAGPRTLTGLSSELAVVAEQAAHAGLSRGVKFSDLAKTIINVPLRVVRVLETSLPPHIEQLPLPLESIIDALRGVSLWPGKVEAKRVYDYAFEADALGLVKLTRFPKDIEKSIVMPRLGTGLQVVDRVSEIGFDVIATTPSRAWIPALTIYGDATTRFPTLEQLLGCETPLLKIVSDVVGRERCERWVKHALNIEAQPGFKMPALARGVAKTFGVLDMVKLGDEKRMLSWSVARRIVGTSFESSDRGLTNVLEEAKKRIESIVKRSGFYGEILKEISTKAFIHAEELERIVSEARKKYNVSGTEEAIIRELERFGFVQATSDNNYYSAWTLTPIHECADENLRALLVWTSREVFTDRREIFTEIFTEITKDLIERKSIDILDKVPDKKTLISVAKKLGRLERMQLIRFLDESTISVVDEEARKLLETAYIGAYIGLYVPLIEVEERSREIELLKEVVAEEATEIAKRKSRTSSN
jgi:DNA-binding MarR family transcriptional regulator